MNEKTRTQLFNYDEKIQLCSEIPNLEYFIFNLEFTTILLYFKFM